MAVAPNGGGSTVIECDAGAGVASPGFISLGFLFLSFFFHVSNIHPPTPSYMYVHTYVFPFTDDRLSIQGTGRPHAIQFVEVASFFLTLLFLMDEWLGRRMNEGECMREEIPVVSMGDEGCGRGRCFLFHSFL